MIAMQYSFTLPADYDMTIIDRRIAEKGPMLDGFAHLKFKAYLSARKSDSATGSQENLYAPFYVWNDPQGISNFLCGPGFTGLTQSFGRPSAKTWIVWNCDLAADFKNARFASRMTSAIAPGTNLESLRTTIRKSTPPVQNNLAGIVTGFDPTCWTRVDFRLWFDLPAPETIGSATIYSIGHMSLGQDQT